MDSAWGHAWRHVANRRNGLVLAPQLKLTRHIPEIVRTAQLVQFWTGPVLWRVSKLIARGCKSARELTQSKTLARPIGEAPGHSRLDDFAIAVTSHEL
jgi:hypothetical protein